MTDDAPSRALDKFVVRFPPGMRERISAAAAASGRSMNAEIVQRLQASFPESLEWLLSNRAAERERLELALENHEWVASALAALDAPPREIQLRHAMLRMLLQEIDFEILELKSMQEMSGDDMLAVYGPNAPGELITLEEERRKLKRKSR